MTPAVPATLPRLARAYAWLLRAYPAPFRREFGDEMSLVFSDCCRAAWRSGGLPGVWLVAGRTVLDVLASAPPLWAERLEEAMRSALVRRATGLCTVDRALALAGLALVLVGEAAWPIALPLGWTALALVFFARVAEADGIALPRPGHAVIRTCGCWEAPLAFGVRHGGAALLFSRDEAPGGGWSDSYTVRQRPDGADVDPRWDLPLSPGNEWPLRGRTPVATLCFERHGRVSYVTRGSLERSLARAA